jgi:DNA-binding CsgD family transcriptional regulator
MLTQAEDHEVSATIQALAHDARLPAVRDMDVALNGHGQRMQLTPLEEAEVVRMVQGLSPDESAAMTQKSASSVRSRRARISWKLRLYWKVHFPSRPDVVSLLVAPSLRILAEEYADAGEASTQAPPRVCWMCVLGRRAPEALASAAGRKECR